MQAGLIVGIVILVLLIVLIPASIRIVKQYENGVVFRLGRFVGVRGAGLNVIVPFIDSLTKVDLRIRTLDVPSQEMITADTVTVRVNAVVYFRVMNAEDAIINVDDFANATWQNAQTTLRGVIGSTDLEHVLSERDEVNERLQKIIDDQTEPWGVKVTVVEVKDVELPEGMQRAMARQAEAERERRAKVIHAIGESEAAERLVNAAEVISSRGEALQLRYLQTLADIAQDRSTVIVFPIPVQQLGALMGLNNVTATTSPPAGQGGSQQPEAGTTAS
jgi:regulator of protease activity HflC (stomatin/prohibitin superfamily)